MLANTQEITEVIKLTKAITGLPPGELIKDRETQLTQEQSYFWREKQQQWRLIGLKIDYLQRIELGDLPKDPLSEIDPIYRIYFDVITNRFYAELNLMITGWELIKEKAIALGKEFPFNNPRELFAESCKQEAILGIESCLSQDINQGETLKEIRDYYRLANSFYRASLEDDQWKEMMEIHKNCQHWRRFMIYAIWDRRLDKSYNKGKLSLAWKQFLGATKAESAMSCKKDYFSKYNAKINTLKWSQGRAVFPQSSQILRVP